ncbi:hypothetical protein ACUHMQ_17245 [Chitinimonas sp. PSY-7]
MQFSFQDVPGVYPRPGTVIDVKNLPATSRKREQVLRAQRRIADAQQALN